MNDLEFLIAGGSEESRKLSRALHPQKAETSTELLRWLSHGAGKRKLLFVSGGGGYDCVRGILREGAKVRYPGCRVMTLTPSTAPLLDGVVARCFGSWVAKPPALLPWTQLAEALKSEHARDLCLGGEVDWATQLVTLLRGDFSLLVVPLSIFQPSGDGTNPNFGDFSITDHGQTLKFGKYEAAFDVVLYEHDPEYRRRLKKQRLDEEQTFGASLRRLRLQRGIGRDAFRGIDAKTIARIERGEVEKPHAATLAIIAKKLGVGVDAIVEY